MINLLAPYALAIWYGARFILGKGYTGGQVLNVFDVKFLHSVASDLLLKGVFCKNVLCWWRIDNAREEFYSFKIFILLKCIFILWVVCTEGPERIRELIVMGASFDHGENGNLHLAREAGHSHRQIVHATDMRQRDRKAPY
ncbi:hypothetical protein H5410_018784 [Solanum commersonii]|uniref:Uncharacterized protein n=1 Tax=Solanum commersonii TaxID=4109 RepID=A0A9J6A3G9_SOLCO|nr:hypothetical protein H5410_018784 [Solanum commersonii]